jgi:hypothetical protein
MPTLPFLFLMLDKIRRAQTNRNSPQRHRKEQLNYLAAAV